jgi:dipeptidase E
MSPSPTRRFRQLFGSSVEAAVITNALDFSDDLARRRTGLRREFEQLSGIGLRPSEVDLRDFFASDRSVHADLNRFGGMWVVGGNVFILRRAMQYSGLDEFIWEKQRSDSHFVYGGYSAGSCVLAPSLRGIELVDPPEKVPDGYQPDVISEGLGILSYCIAPHFDSDHPEPLLINNVVDYFETHHVPYKALRDGEAIIVGAENSRSSCKG